MFLKTKTMQNYILTFAHDKKTFLLLRLQIRF